MSWLSYASLIWIYVWTGAFVLGWIAQWQFIDLKTERQKYAWTWHWRYLGCLTLWPLVMLFVVLQNISIRLSYKEDGSN